MHLKLTKVMVRLSLEGSIKASWYCETLALISASSLSFAGIIFA